MAYYPRARTHSHSSQNPPKLSPAYPYAAIEPEPYAYPSPGGFVIPQTQERGFGVPKVNSHKHSDKHHDKHSHHHTQQQHHHHSSRRRTHSHSRTDYNPNVVVHVNGQTYTNGQATYTSTQQYAVARPGHKYSSSMQAHNGSVSTAPQQSYYTQPQMQMPMPITPPQDLQHYGPGNQYSFQYSRCTGRRKALCIGINYIGQPNQLNGCINDARRMRNFLIDNYKFLPGDIVLLTDDGKTAREKPTKQNILDAMRWLVNNHHRDDSLFFHYSGHGGQTKDLDGDEEDGFDEVIYPVDWKTKGHIVDDRMHEIMVKPLSAGTRLMAVFDCCHSGSALDLPYMYGSNGRLKHEPVLTHIGGGMLKRSVEGLTRAFGDLDVRSGGGGGGRVPKYRRRNALAKTSPADVISLSGCEDSQTSADTFEKGKATGAMSYALMYTLKDNPHQTYQQLLLNIRKILKSNFSQKPQLSSSHPIDTNLKFVL